MCVLFSVCARWVCVCVAPEGAGLTLQANATLKREREDRGFTEIAEEEVCTPPAAIDKESPPFTHSAFFTPLVP